MSSGEGGRQGYQVILEIYKDEKAVSKGDSCKGCIDVSSVVDAHRVLVGKKQSFEILCPGIGYRFMATSEVEADEWTRAIQRHIMYKKEVYPPYHTTPCFPSMSVPDAAMKSLSLSSIPSVSHSIHPHHGHHMANQIHERQMAIPGSLGVMGVAGTNIHPSFQHQPQHQFFHGHHQHQSVPILFPSQRGLVQVNNHLSGTPPSASPPSFSSYRFPHGSAPSFQTQRSTENGGPSSLASHSTSSESSSMCSSSNTSFEGGGGGGVFEIDGLESSKE